MKASKEEGKDVEMFKWVLEAIPTLASADALNQKSQVGQHGWCLVSGLTQNFIFLYSYSI